MSDRLQINMRTKSDINTDLVRFFYNNKKII